MEGNTRHGTTILLFALSVAVATVLNTFKEKHPRYQFHFPPPRLLLAEPSGAVVWTGD